LFKKFLYIIVITVFIFAAIGLFLPRHVHIERSVEIARPASTVFTVLNGYQAFLAWSPWADRDPDAVYELSGPDRGPGARLSWTGDPRLVGSGWQEIVASEPWSLIRMRLDFDQQGVADTYYQLDETATGVRLTWGFDTDLLDGQGLLGGILARYFGLFFDRWIGRDYEQGLANLKTYVESLPPADFSTLQVERTVARSQSILSATSGGDQSRSGLASAFRQITAFMAEQGIERAGQPMTITRSLPDGRWTLEAAIPVAAAGAAAALDLPSGLALGRSPEGAAVHVRHRGPHERLGETYAALAAWLAAHGVAEAGVSWEQYVSDPGATAPEDLVTDVFVLLAETP